MKQKLLEFLLSRFTEKSSATGLGAIVAGGFGVYTGMQSHDPGQEVVSGIGILFGLVAFLTKDGHVMEYVSFAQAAVKGQPSKK